MALRRYTEPSLDAFSSMQGLRFQSVYGRTDRNWRIEHDIADGQFNGKTHISSGRLDLLANAQY